MVYMPVPEDPQIVVAGLIDAHVRQLGGTHSAEDYVANGTVGRFTAVAGATVEARALAKFERAFLGDRRTVAVGGVAQCFGFGCATSSSGETFAAAVPLDTDRHDVAAQALPLIQKAREWAQAHAERCRAQRYTGD